MFKKWSIAVLAVLVVGNVSASENWQIDRFDVVAKIQPNGTVRVVETIVADFSHELNKHGIFRTLPFRYKNDDGRKFTTPLQVIEVSDESGRTRPYKILMEGDFKKIRIGDPNRTVGTREVYKISYAVNGVLQSFADHDEFFWNVTGYEWPVKIAELTATVSLPEDSELLRTKCFTGQVGSKRENCTVETVDERTVKFEPNAELVPGEGWTIVFGFDRGMVTVVDREYDAWIGVSKILNGVLLLPPLVLLWWILRKRKKRRKILQVGRPVIPMYEPPSGLLPAGVGVIRDNRLDARDITASIVSLAVRGYLKISETKSGLLGLSRDYILTRTKKLVAEGDDFDKSFLTALFDQQTVTQFSDLKNKFYRFVPNLQLAVENKLKKHGLFRTTKISLLPETLLVQGLIVVAVMVVVLGGSGWVWLTYGVAFLIGNVLLRTFPSKKTVRGAEVAHEIRGYREFLITAEVDRLEWMEQQNIFEKNLPYAIALGVSGIWAKRFANLVRVPEWYAGDADLKMDNFGSRMDGLSHDFHDTAMSVSKRAGSGFSSGSSGFGGGFSGGGGGGGGGGSW